MHNIYRPIQTSGVDFDIAISNVDGNQVACVRVPWHGGDGTVFTYLKFRFTRCRLQGTRAVIHDVRLEFARRKICVGSNWIYVLR